MRDLRTLFRGRERELSIGAAFRCLSLICVWRSSKIMQQHKRSWMSLFSLGQSRTCIKEKFAKYLSFDMWSPRTSILRIWIHFSFEAQSKRVLPLESALCGRYLYARCKVTYILYVQEVLTYIPSTLLYEMAQDLLDVQHTPCVLLE